MKVEIFSDVVCPWCYIGHHRLRQAVGLYEGDVEVTHRPFQLDPDGVSSGEPLLSALERKFGGAARVTQMTGHVTGVAAQDGLDLRFDRAVAANTFEAHRLIWLAGRAGRDGDMADRLFRAHFTDGLDVGDPATLATLAAETGVEDTGDGAEQVRAELARARTLGVRAVPLFLFEEKFAVSGAQPVETLVAALREVEARTTQERTVRVPAGEDCDDGACAV
ncbi:DsbA family protein [Microbispora sp. GKU 823]|uniref:DsbA family oxidoreductase n=1 Tax=Microbispora sp. GKU 823 TaxID=1652100 RepID=UPI0009A35B66|nr:DsbA family oxidoreductase [Microbispora sp. GKU 823]OPG13227.1 disulfide bond formation protein DsbA [Microbispora sp. GKU 823]